MIILHEQLHIDTGWHAKPDITLWIATSGPAPADADPVHLHTFIDELREWCERREWLATASEIQSLSETGTLPARWCAPNDDALPPENPWLAFLRFAEEVAFHQGWVVSYDAERDGVCTIRIDDWNEAASKTNP